MSCGVIEEEEMESDDWSLISGRKGQGKRKSGRNEGRMADSQTSKRGLEGNSSDEDNRVVRKKMVTEEYKIILKFRKEDENVTLSPIALSKELRKKIGEVDTAKILRDGSLLVICKTEDQKNKALKMDSVGKKKVNERKILGERRMKQGVITGIPIEEDLEKLKQTISGGEVSRIKRLKRTMNGERMDSLSILLDFHDPVLPERVKIGYLSFAVRPFIPPPLRCYKCQKYGHIAAVCKGKQRCPKCGGEHRIENCEENTQDKCCNCGGQHRVTYSGCNVRKRAEEIEQVKVVNNISYAEAVKKVQEQKRNNDTGKDKDILRTEAGSVEGRSTTLTMDRLIVFIAYVINCTDQVRHKTEKIKIIVKGAEKFLGMSDISWENINKKLEDDGKSGGAVEKTN
jgi:hypothetical protein